LFHGPGFGGTVAAAGPVGAAGAAAGGAGELARIHDAASMAIGSDATIGGTVPEPPDASLTVVH
jgi:hypothetical protein